MNDNVRNELLLTAVESSIARILREAYKLQICVEIVAELRKYNPANTPCADLRISASALRTTAIKLEELAKDVEQRDSSFPTFSERA